VYVWDLSVETAIRHSSTKRETIPTNLLEERCSNQHTIVLMRRQDAVSVDEEDYDGADECDAIIELT